MKEAVKHYEAALKAAFPNGATGAVVFYHWNEARKALEQPAQQEPLTDEEINVMSNDFEEGYGFLYRSFARAIEAAHGITGEQK